MVLLQTFATHESVLHVCLLNFLPGVSRSDTTNQTLNQFYQMLLHKKMDTKLLENKASANGQRKIALAELKRVYSIHSLLKPAVPGQQARPLKPKNSLRHQTLEPEIATMLLFMQNGEQRLVTFSLPLGSCTLQEVLAQLNIPVSENTYVQCMQNENTGSLEVDYFVAVDCNTNIKELLENHPILLVQDDDL